MTARPAYKNHPLWQSAMAMTRDAYALADRVKERSPAAARGLRKAAVAVPAHLAAAVSDRREDRGEHALAARSALAEVIRQVRRVEGEDSRDLARQAETLDLSVLFELGRADVFQ